MVHTSEFLAGAFAALLFAGRWLFRGPWSADITDHVIEQTLVYQGPWNGWEA